MSRKSVGHRHACASRWERDYSREYERIYHRAGVEVMLEPQARVFYPPGDRMPACCCDVRTVVVVRGEIRSLRVALSVAKALRHAALRIKTARAR